MVYVTEWLETGTAAPIKAEAVDMALGEYMHGIAVTIGTMRIVLHAMSAEQVEALSVQLHTAAITLGLVVSDPEPDTGADDSGIDLDRAAAASGF